MKQIHVAAAAIYRGRELLLSRRHEHVHQGGKWEFPGGKLESGEAVEAALKRELFEELAITPTRYSPLIRVHHNYPDLSVLLDVWRVDAFSGEPEGCEGQEIAWFRTDELGCLEFPEANLPIVKAVVLPEVFDGATSAPFQEGQDYLVWQAQNGLDWKAFYTFTEQAMLPVYLNVEQGAVDLGLVRKFGGQGIIRGVRGTAA